MKKIHHNSVIGQQGINFIEKVVLDMGFVWYPTGAMEAGIDGIIEIRDAKNGEVTNSIIQVQSKATQGSLQAETADGFDYLCEENDLEYWLRGNAPVILIRSRPDTKEAYWISIKDYFKEPEKRKTRKIHFDKKQDRFADTSKAALMDLAIPRDAGIYFAPLPKEETLYSNLLEVNYFPEHLYIAETKYRTGKEIRAELQKLNATVGGEWIPKYKSILSFSNLEEHPWDKICDVGSLEIHEAAEWAYSDDSDKRHDFVQLLNRCLRDKTWKQDLRYSERHECYYFRATHDLSPRKVKYQSIVNKTPRTVFQGYLSKRDSTKIAYYRHSAFEEKFVLYDNQWYLEITPTYYFTRDGSYPDPYYEDRLTGIKQLEKNPAILGQVIMWADYLSKEDDLFKPEYPFLKFGELLTFDSDLGIHDKLWLPHEEEDVRKSLSSDDPELFE